MCKTRVSPACVRSEDAGFMVPVLVESISKPPFAPWKRITERQRFASVPRGPWAKLSNLSPVVNNA